MADILPFKRPSKRPHSSDNKAASNTLCRNGHHQWRIVKEKQFDVRQGKLITLHRCDRCGKEKVTAQ